MKGDGQLLGDVFTLGRESSTCHEFSLYSSLAFRTSLSQNIANVEFKHVVLADERGQCALGCPPHTSLCWLKVGLPSVLCRSHGEVLSLLLTIVADSDLPKKVSFDLILN